MEETAVETDNKAVRKTITEALERIKHESFIKIACLNTVRSGFTVPAYLETKAKASIEVPAPKKRGQKVIGDSSDITEHPALYQKIKSWRDQKARAMNLPHYMILPQKTMATLSGFLPQTPDALKNVKGMGAKKTEKFGEELLSIITEFCRNNNIAPAVELYPAKAKTVKAKINTKGISFDLFKNGKSISEIADERNMAVSTIEGHLAYYVGTGELSVHEFVSPDIASLVAEHFRESGDLQLSPVKASLGDRVSWSEVRFVMKHLEHLRKTENVS